MNFLEQLSTNQWLAILVLVLIVSFWLWAKLQKFWQWWRGTLSRRQGQSGELNARKLLTNQGYQVIEDPPKFTSQLRVNGSSRLFPIKPDMVVRKDGITYVVEVKSGDQSGISSAAVRRQVLEYLHATGMPCLLVRMSEGEVDIVQLEPQKR